MNALLGVLLAAAAAQARSVSRIALPDGAEMSRIAYGTLHIAEVETAEAALQRLHGCVAQGITTIDLADVYASGRALEIVGEAFALDPALRASLELVAKLNIVHGDNFSYLDTTREHMIEVVDLYLAQLNTTYLDFLLLHWPDPLVDLPALAEFFVELREAGVVKHFGVSNYNVDQVHALQALLPFPLVTNEIEASILVPDVIFDGSIQRMGMPIFAWGPLGGDPFAGPNRLFKVDGPEQRAIKQGLEEVAKRHDTFADVVAVAWLLRVPHPIIPILGTVTMDRLVNQSGAEAIAEAMSVEDWWTVADAAGLSAFGKYDRPRP